MDNWIKIIVQDLNNKKLSEYEAKLLPMIGDEIDVPNLGTKQIIKRVFDVNKQNEVILIIK